MKRPRKGNYETWYDTSCRTIFSIPTDSFPIHRVGISQGIIKFSSILLAKGENEQAKEIIHKGMLARTLIGVIIFAINFLFAERFAILLNRQSLTPYIQIVSFPIIFQVIFTTQQHSA